MIGYFDVCTRTVRIVKTKHMMSINWTVNFGIPSEQRKIWGKTTDRSQNWNLQNRPTSELQFSALRSPVPQDFHNEYASLSNFQKHVGMIDYHRSILCSVQASMAWCHSGVFRLYRVQVVQSGVRDGYQGRNFQSCQGLYRRQDTDMEKNKVGYRQLLPLALKVRVP